MSSVQCQSAPAGLLEALEARCGGRPTPGSPSRYGPGSAAQGPRPSRWSPGRTACPDAIAAGAVVCLRWEEQHRLGDVLAAILRSEQHLRRRMRRAERDSRRASRVQSTRDLLGRSTPPRPVMAVDLRAGVVFNRAAESAGYDAAWALAHMHVTDVYVDRTGLGGCSRRSETAPTGSSDTSVPLGGNWRAAPVSLSAAEVYAADGMPIGTVGVFMDRRRELALRERLEQTFWLTPRGAAPRM